MLFSMLNFVVLVKILYKEDIGTGTAIEKTPEMQRIKQTQDAISTVQNPTDFKNNLLTCACPTHNTSFVINEPNSNSGITRTHLMLT